jgi:hypothetical protein
MNGQLVFFGLVLTVLTASVAAAKLSTLVPESGVPAQGNPKFNITVRNEADQAIQFLLRPKGAIWSTYTLSPGEKGVYSCSGCGGDFEISLSTAGTVVTYDIATGKLYAIRVNDARHIYDIYVVP